MVILVLCLLFNQLNIEAQNINYSVESISEELKKNAGSIVRHQYVEFEVESDSKAKFYQKVAITILHESHRSKSYFQETYDEFTKLSNIKICIYDKHGKKVKTVAKKDIIDMSAFSEGALFAEIRQKVYSPEYYEYPFTIEYSFNTTYSGLLAYPTFVPIYTYGLSVEKSEYRIIVPASNELRYLLVNTQEEPSIQQLDDKNLYKWKFENLKAYKNEDYDCWLSDMVPMVRTAPVSFEMDGYPGNMTSWESFGDWIALLNSGRDVLPPSAISEVKKITNELQTKREKVKAVYKYMQSKTRYVNVIIGIGGWQPFSAEDVDKNGYGDCKALTNYTYALLKAINIESIYTLIRAGENSSPIYDEFPSNQFNHAILCVPIAEEDTIWLECTSQRNPFAYLGSFTEGRDVLLIKPNNESKLAKTPGLKCKNNLRLRKAKVKIDINGNAKADIEMQYKGIYFDDKRTVFYYEGKRRMDMVRNNIHINNFSLNDEAYSIEEIKGDLPSLIEKYNVSANSYVKKLGGRILFNINFFNTEINVPSSINRQESELYIHRSRTKIDSLEFSIPDGYFIKSAPKNDTIISEYGEFYTHFKVDGNKLYYTRKQIINKGDYPAENYQDLRAYLKKISVSDKQKVLVMPKE